MDEVSRAGALVQVVDILRAKKEAARELRFELGQSNVRGVRIGFLSLYATLRVESPHSGGVAAPGIGRADVLDAVTCPKAVFGAEVGSPLSALMPAPVRMKTRSVGEIRIEDIS